MAKFAMRTIFGRRTALRLFVAGCGSLSLAAFPALGAVAPDTPTLQRLAAIIPPTAAARLAARLRNINGGATGVERELQDALGRLRREAGACPAGQPVRKRDGQGKRVSVSGAPRGSRHIKQTKN